MENKQAPVEGEFISSSDMLELEKERIKSHDKRTDVAILAIQKNDEADKRMFDFHMAKLAQDTGIKAQQVTIARNLIYGTSIAAGTIVLSLLFFSFYGDNNQSQLASSLLSSGVKALSGIGLYLLGKGAFNKLTKSPSE